MACACGPASACARGIPAAMQRFDADAEVRRVTEETLRWVDREMTAPGGGWYSSLDADSEGEEGRFFVWDRDEIAAVLGVAEPQGRLSGPYAGLAGLAAAALPMVVVSLVRDKVHRVDVARVAHDLRAPRVAVLLLQHREVVLLPREVVGHVGLVPPVAVQRHGKPRDRVLAREPMPELKVLMNHELLVVSGWVVLAEVASA